MAPPRLPHHPTHPNMPKGLPRMHSNESLLDLVNELAIRYFGRTYNGRVEWNFRMRTRAGDYAPRLKLMRLSARYAKEFGDEELVGTIKHELCHWYLWEQGIAHRHDSRAFKELMQRVDAPRYAKRTQVRTGSSRRYVYRCTFCGIEFVRRRKIQGACKRCCRLWNNGAYDARFRVRLVRQYIERTAETPKR